jgi:hypothetical protein
MVMWSATALAASVVCDPAEARRILEDANVDELRAPVTHPWLVPGLARSVASPEVAAAIGAVCQGGGDLSVERADQWEDVGWAAYALVLTLAERDACGLVHRRVPLSIGISDGVARYSIRGELPDERTPLEGCEEAAVWRSEETVDGDRSPVRLVSVGDHRGEQVERHLVARRAGPEGWTDQRLLDVTPPRLLDPRASGPVVRLARTRGGEPWVVSSHERRGPGCVAVGGQVVWRWVDGRWERSEGREALAWLTREGLWRFAGDDGWMLILAQDNDRQEALLEPRQRRLQRLVSEPLLRLESADFPKLNPGFYVLTPAPWATAAEARAARAQWDIPSSYIKRAWVAVDPCARR